MRDFLFSLKLAVWQVKNYYHSKKILKPSMRLRFNEEAFRCRNCESFFLISISTFEAFKKVGDVRDGRDGGAIMFEN